MSNIVEVRDILVDTLARIKECQTVSKEDRDTINNIGVIISSIASNLNPKGIVCQTL